MRCNVLPILLLFATQISRLSSVGSSPNDTISLTMKNVNPGMHNLQNKNVSIKKIYIHLQIAL